jgi:zinc transporter ZupT
MARRLADVTVDVTPHVQQLVPVVFIFGLGLTGVLLGMWLEQIPRISRIMLLLSGGLLVAIPLILVAPELAEHYGWAGGLLWMALGFAALWLVDRYVYPLCPACAHNHNHDSCAVPLHGFAAPLVLASGLHSFMDGWSLVASRQDPSQALQFAFLMGITLHKLPEGVALGAILRASLRSRWRVAGGGALAQFMTVAGGAVALWLAAWVGARWSGAFLGLAGGTFLYLGYHTLEAEWERRSAAH